WGRRPARLPAKKNPELPRTLRPLAAATTMTAPPGVDRPLPYGGWQCASARRTSRLRTVSGTRPGSTPDGRVGEATARLRVGESAIGRLCGTWYRARWLRVWQIGRAHV